jgi:hypothetical protein
MDSFNREYNKIVDGTGSGGLRNSAVRNQSLSSSTSLKMASPFTNDLLKQTMQYNQFENLNGSAIKSLQ